MSTQFQMRDVESTLETVLELVKKYAHGADAHVDVHASRQANTRYARNEITSSGDTEEMSIGLALAFKADDLSRASALAMTAAMLHALNHMLFKSLLFFAAGAVLTATGTRDLNRLGGLFDPASAAGLENNDEDFGQTLGKWGVKPGPYLMLPILGPTNVRDGLARIPDQFTYPITYVNDDTIQYGVRVLSFLDLRAGLLDLDAQLERSYDRYAFVRNAWMQRREFQVKDGDVERQGSRVQGRARCRHAIDDGVA